MQKSSIVICINDTFPPRAINMYSKLPKIGDLYMVREIVPPVERPTDTPGVMLEEINGKLISYKCYDGIVRIIEFHFIVERFVEVLPPVELFICEEKELSALI